MTAPATHQPVLLSEAVAALAIRPAGQYLDATFGRGGHAAAILAALNEQGRLIALDRDPNAIAAGRQRYPDDARLVLRQANFAELGQHGESMGLGGKLAGILLDLGVSSPQLDNPERGFGFRQDGPLDMRMDPACGPSAADWLAQASETEIARILKELGEERYARRIARNLVNARRERPINRTQQLAELIAAAVPTRELHKHPATRSFQAIRMHINQELAALASALQAALTLLEPGGRLVVISFHSLEDRLVKRFIRQESQVPALPRKLPVTDSQAPTPHLRAVGKPQFPSEAETALNPRARSACLRIAERRA